MPAEKLSLGAVDWVVLAAALLASASIGVIFSRGSATSEDFLLAGRGASSWPAALSLMATFMSATNIMGLPADIYSHGTHMAFMNVGFVVGPLLSAYLLLPVFFGSHFTTAYEYLEKRFGRNIRRFVSAMFSVQMVLSTAATLYAPALALSAVTDMPLWTAVVTMGTVCTFYCTMGGMKAVLWTDVLQAALMYAGLISIIVIGSNALGGVTTVFEMANEGGRLLLPSLKFDLSQQYTFWNILAQASILTLSSLGGSQISVQRLMAVRNLRQSRIVTFLFIPMLVSFQLLCCMCGIVFYAYFRSCDPMTSPDKPIDSADQLMPLFITNAMRSLPGLPGLCIAGIFSASLSTVSSAVNSLAAVTYEDFIAPLCPRVKERPVMCTKLLSVAFGCLCVALSFAAASLGRLLRLTILIVGMFAGPNLAVFLLAAGTRAATERGTLVGLVAGLALGAYLNMSSGAMRDPPLPVSTECPLANISLSFAATSPLVANKEGQQFHLAYMWYSTAGLLTSLILGYFASIVITACSDKTTDVPDIYLSPVRIWFSKNRNMSKGKESGASPKESSSPMRSVQQSGNRCDTKL